MHGDRSEFESMPSTSSSRVQDSLKKKLITEDDYTWKLQSGEAAEEEESSGVELLKYIGGVDVSFLKDNPSVACGTLVVLDFKTLDVVYEDSLIVTIDVLYLPGFLAFREAPIFLELLKKMQDCSHPFYPQLHHVDGLTKSRVRELLVAEENFNADFISLIGDSGNTLGAAIHSSKGSFKPIFVSVGHRVSLASAVEIVKRTCRYRVPEPIRQANNERAQGSAGNCLTNRSMWALTSSSPLILRCIFRRPPSPHISSITPSFLKRSSTSISSLIPLSLSTGEETGVLSQIEIDDKRPIETASEHLVDARISTAHKELLSKLKSMSVKEKKDLGSYAHSLGKSLNLNRWGNLALPIPSPPPWLKP
ncbi:hypothetical protein E3N88_08098 [Mikania micrantha]|uniref:Endonuclease V n=1 Tax=Mikania micrantha TaxID=192012 RepID=A0A5N6PHC7_9ASTR|nr:hypothetical protein E3N88_08098 [Mikania micrantha]